VRRGLVQRAEEWKGSSVREYAQAALALLVTCRSTSLTALSASKGHSSLVTEDGCMQTNQRADAACLPAYRRQAAGRAED
jgi:hypothetical protein